MSGETGNLTKGPILRVLTKLALPIVAAAFLSTAYNIMDMAWVGQLGAKALAGVGVGGMYLWLSQGLSMMARMGGQVYMAQEVGRGNRKEAGCYAATAIQLGILFGVLFGVVCIVFAEPLTAFFGLSSAEAVAASEIYIRITCGLVIFSYLSLVLTGLYTAQGNSKTPLEANFIGLAVNMVLDPCLILGLGPFPRLEVAGAAIATVTAQAIVVGVMTVGIRRDRSRDNILRDIKIFRISEKFYLKRVVTMGGPSALQTIVYCMISMVLSRMIGKFGDAAIAVFRVGGQIESISWNIANGFSAAINAFAAQNFGAGEMKRVKEGYRVSMWTVLIWGGLVTAAFVVFPEQISGVFFHKMDEIVLCVDYLIIMGVGEAPMCLEMMSVGAISGLGNTKLCSIISIVFTGMRIPLALMLGLTSLGLNGIWWAMTISSVAKGIIFYGAFQRECRMSQHGE